MADHKNLPKGRLGRLARLASAGVRSGAQMLTRREGSAAARHAAEVLGNLRGLATKVGQMASYVDGVLPDLHHEAYERWMSTLQSAAPQSEPAAILRAVEEGLGAPIDELFARWDPEPVASASIGQVHRAVLPDGRVVAVKVQHPGVAEALEADLRNAGLLESALGALGGFRRFESKRVLEEVRARFREELDYNLEADRQRQFGRLFAADPQVRVPGVIDERCARRVLTTEFVSGLGLAEASARSVPERIAWAETLWRFVYRSSLVGGLFNADPHPGNYFFQPDGAVVFLDFGCVQPLAPHHAGNALDLHRAAHAQDMPAFRRAACSMLELQGGAYEPRAVAYVELAFQTLLQRPFQVQGPFVTELVDEMKRLVADFRRGKGDGYVPLPEGVFFLNRLQFGFYSVLARLNVPVDYTAVELRFLADEPI